MTTVAAPSDHSATAAAPPPPSIASTSPHPNVPVAAPVTLHATAVPASAAPAAAAAPAVATQANAAPSTHLVLPAGCSTIGSGSLQVVVCQPQHETAWDKFLPTVPALSVSVLALVVSLGALVYNQRKDNRARRQSIVDDFWLRKVVAPVSIEPFLKATTDLCANLPDGKWASNGVQSFWKDQAAESAKLSVAFMAFNLIDQPLCVALTGMLEGIDDIVAEYCGLLQQSLDNQGVPPPPDRNEAIEAIQAVCMKVYNAIKFHQELVGNS